MDHICYVMMPFGGDDPKKRARYEGVFSSIIIPAAHAAGFSDDEIIRQDSQRRCGFYYPEYRYQHQQSKHFDSGFDGCESKCLL